MKIKNVKEIPQELKTTITTIIELRTDFELATAEQFSPWLVNAPTADDRLFVARLVSDKLNHSLQLIRILEELNAKEIAEKLQNARLGLHKLDVSNLPLFNWEDVIAFIFLVDRAALYQLRVLKDCTFEPLSNLASNMIREEETHIIYSQNALKDYQNKDRMQGAINFWFPRAIELLYAMRSLNPNHLELLNISRLVKEEMVNEFVAVSNEELKKFGFKEVEFKKALHYNI